MYLFIDNHAGDIYENTYVLLHWTRGGFVKTSTNLSTVRPLVPIAAKQYSIKHCFHYPEYIVSTQLHISYWSIN